MPFTHPDNITIPSDRYRKDFSSVEKRAKEIEEMGQFTPILVRRDGDSLILIDGECRTRACKLLDREVWYTTNEDGRLLIDDEFKHRLTELMSNIARSDMTPSERACAIADLDRLMKETQGRKAPGPGKDKEGHTTADTAKMLGYSSVRTVEQAKVIAEATTIMPELSEAKTMSEAAKMVKVKLRLDLEQELARRQSAKPQNGPIPDPLDYFSKRIILGDCLEQMKKLDSGIVSIFLTDIPYAIDYKTEDIQEDAQRNSKKNLFKKVAGLYHDLPEDILPLVEGVIGEMARTGRPNCFAYMFCAFRYWNHLSIIFEKNGFKVNNKPLIWVRGSLSDGTIEPGGCNSPETWPASVTDCILFAKKGTMTLAKQGQPDVLIYRSVPPSKKIHSLQRPLPLLMDLISRVNHGDTKGILVDPFAGSGSTLAAAMRFPNLSYFGYELDPDNRNRAIAYLVNEYHRMNNPEPEPELSDLDELDI